MIAIALAVISSSHGSPLDADSSITNAPNERWLIQPQWQTSARLLRPGESIEFTLWAPEKGSVGELSVFPRYLENAKPGENFSVDGGLAWLDELPHETLALDGSGRRPLQVAFRPERPGSYIARWRVGNETLYRYFAVVDDTYVVIRFGGYHEIELDSSLHATGIPMDFPLPMERPQGTDEDSGKVSERFIGYQRLFGDGVVPQLPDAPEMADAERTSAYREMLDRFREMTPEPEASRCARVEMWKGRDPGYAKSLRELGVVSHFGLQMANGGSWLGMPEFPYFVSKIDMRKADQTPKARPPLVCHQWDFCGGWHFLGPQSWHWSISKGDWSRVEPCLTRGVAEAALASENSGRPTFIFPLYDGNLEHTDANRLFVEKFQRHVAFKLPKQFNVVFARAIDVADYYCRHESATPRTVFISKTDAEEIFYVINWHNLWAGRHEMVTCAELPWLTRNSSIFEVRDRFHGAKDPMAFEYMVVEDQRRSLRFERGSPNPIWWHDYTQPEKDVTEKGSTIHWTKTPDVDWVEIGEHDANVVGRPPNLPEWERTEVGSRLRLKMATTSHWPDYAIVLWGLPPSFAERPDPKRIATSAKSSLVAKNPDGEYHLYLEFDLEPEKILEVEIRN